PARHSLSRLRRPKFRPQLHEGAPAQQMNATVTILLDEPIGVISPLVHGHFAEHLGRCCNDGLWVGPNSPIENIGGLRLDVIRALRDLGVPILRWPGGCYADTYH